MSKTLILKPRQPDGLGGYGWHDKNILDNVLSATAKGKDMIKASIWIILGRKIQLACNAVNLFKKEPLMEDGEQVKIQGQRLYQPKMAEVSVVIRNQEASLLWREISRLNLEQFSGNGQVVPNVPLLAEWLFDLAEQLGEKIPEEDEDEKNGDDVQENA
jgi:hypothetical protein